jgi:hypothetical protein
LFFETAPIFHIGAVIAHKKDYCLGYQYLFLLLLLLFAELPYDWTIRLAAPTAPKVPPPAASDTDATPVPLELLVVVLLFSTTSITRYSLVLGHCSITCCPSRKYSFLSSFSVFILTSFLLSSSNLYATGSNCFESKAG